MYGQRYGTANKYRNVRQTYNGYNYQSKKEARYAYYLDQRLKNKEILGWDRQVKIDLQANGQHICNYYMDFVIHNLDGTHTLAEIKGFETDVWRLKKRMLEVLWLPEHLDYNYIVER